MYAVIETGGKQYRVSPGDVVYVETLEGEEGAAVEFDRVLAVSTESNQLLAGEQASSARVRGTIKSQTRGEKILVFKFKRKSNIDARSAIGRIALPCRFPRSSFSREAVPWHIKKV